MEQQQQFSNVLTNTDQRMKEIEAFRNKPISRTAQTLGMVGLTLGGVFLVGMFALNIITGVMALVVTGASLVGLWWGWQYVKNADPLIQQKAKNAILNRMVKEAKRNAVAQLDNQVLQNHQKLADAKTARNKMGALVETMKAKVMSMDRTSSNYERMVSTLERVSVSYETVKESVDIAAERNKQFEKKVQEYKEMDDFANLAGEAMALFDSSNGAKLQEMLSLESFKAIDADFNTALIAIENSARDMETTNG